jgi:3-deoxy-D-manno-octulosonate 8-phosphate phosphatase (KDO 8-P phosphatase)
MADFSQIKTFIFDVDGVLTDGTVMANTSGEQTRRFYVKDGYGIEKALKAGFHILIITGGFEDGVEKRLRFLGITDIFMGVKDKLATFEEYTKKKNLNKEEILYMGDDIPDYQMLKRVGLPTCPADASEDILALAQYISPYDGGRGAVRDVIEKVMRAQDKWTPELW